MAIALSALALALYLPALGTADFVGDDEALDSGVVFEMHRTGDWWFPEFNGEYLPPKPPLYYWAANATAAITGAADEWSLRAPSALAAAVLIGFTAYAMACARGIEVGVVAALMLLTMPLVRDQARVGRCDMLLALLVTACLFVALRGFDSRARRWSFAALLGLAAVTKGGAGVGIVVAALAAAAIAERDLRRLRILVDPAMIAFVIVGGSWYALAAWHWGARFVDEQILGENLHHLAGGLVGGTAISDRNPGTRSLAYHLGHYPRNLFVTTLPWSLVLPLAFVELWRRRPMPADQRFFLAWIVGGVSFLTLASRKSPYYLLPLCPAVAAVAASWLAPRIRESLSVRPLRLPLGPRGLVALLAVAIVLWLIAGLLPIGGCRWQAITQGLYEHPLATIGALWLLGAAITGALAAAIDRHWATGFAAMVVALASAWILADHVEGGMTNCRSLKPFAREVAAKVGPSDPVFFFRTPLPAVILYAERRIPPLREPAAPVSAPFFLIVPESLRAEVPPSWIASSKVVASGRGRVFTRRPMGIELLRIEPQVDPSP